MSPRWYDIPSYEGRYEVSDSGIVRAYTRNGFPGKELKQHEVRGYLQVWLSKNNKVRKLSVHRAVLMAFDRLPNDGEVANHKDGNKLNNHLENLEWCTREENERHKREVLGKDDKGERNGNYGYRKANFFPSKATRNRLAALGVPRNRHDIVSLGEMLPSELNKGGWEHWNNKFESYQSGKHWVVRYQSGDMMCIEHKSQTEAEARALMLAYLIENGLIKI